MVASATVAATQVWVNDINNPTVQVVTGSSGSQGGGGQRLTVGTVVGAARNYAQGRVRSITGPNTNTQVSVTLRTLTPAEVAQLRTWRDAGTVLCFRDTYGQKVIGTIFTVSEYYIPLATTYGQAPVTGNPMCDVALVINSVSGSTTGY